MGCAKYSLSVTLELHTASIYYTGRPSHCGAQSDGARLHATRTRTKRMHSSAFNSNGLLSYQWKDKEEEENGGVLIIQIRQPQCERF